MFTKRAALHAVVAVFAASTLVTTFAYAAPRDVSHSTSPEVRLDYLSRLLESKSGQRLKVNDPSTALKIEVMLTEARTAITNGDNIQANELGKTGLNALMRAVQHMPENPEETARYKARYENLLQGLSKFVSAQKNNMERFNSDPVGNYNKSAVSTLFDSSKQLAADGKYHQAVAQLNEAQSILTSSLQSLLNNKQLVIELDIGTPEKEYAYEARRYHGYEELIPIALEVKKPSPSVSEKMLKLGKKAEWMSDQARKKATEQDFPVAIRMMMDATNVVRQALRMAGVMM